MVYSVKNLFLDLIISIQILLKNIYGTAIHPYLTYKHLTRTSHFLPSFIPFAASIAIFNFRAPLKQGLPDSLLTASSTLIINLTTSVLGFLFISFVIYSLIKQYSRITYLSILTIWIYSYIPTIIWFFITQSTYVLLPPPRTQSLLGVLFTIVYLSLSLSLLAWKLLLLWLTFQIHGQLTPRQNFFASVVTSIFVVSYWYLLYSLNLWGIPFL